MSTMECTRLTEENKLLLKAMGLLQREHDELQIAAADMRHLISDIHVLTRNPADVSALVGDIHTLTKPPQKQDVPPWHTYAQGTL